MRWVIAEEKPDYSKLRVKDRELVLQIAENNLNEIPENLNQSQKKLLLFAAARFGNTDVINLLLGDPVDLELLNDNFAFHKKYEGWEYPNQEIHAMMGYYFTSRYTNINALMVAIRYGHTDAAKLLIEKGTDLKLRTKGWRGEKAIHLAARYGRTEIVRAIIEKDPTTLNEFENPEITALMEAADRGQLETVKLLLENNASLEGALRFAKDGGHKNILIHLVNETDILNNNTNEQFSTARYAINMGMFVLFNALIDKFPDLVNTTDDNGKNLLHHVAQKHYDSSDTRKTRAESRYRMEKLLLSKKPELATQRDNKKHPASYGSEYGKPRDLLRLISKRDQYKEKDYRRIKFLGITWRYSASEKYNAANHLIQYELNNHMDDNILDDEDLKVLKGSAELKTIYKHLSK